MCFQNNIPSNDEDHPLHFTSRIQIISSIKIQSQIIFTKQKMTWSTLKVQFTKSIHKSSISFITKNQEIIKIT